MQSRNILQMISPKRFMVQLVMIFLIFALGAILAIGIPATLLLQRQTSNQMRALLDQTSKTTETLMENKRNQLDNLAVLLLERPTLNTMLSTGASAESIAVYLDEIRQNSAIDAILICNSQSLITIAGFDNGDNLCEINPDNFLTIVNGHAWLMANAILPTGQTILVSQQLDSALGEFSTQTGLGYALLNKGDWIAGTLNLQESGLSADLPTYQPLSLGNQF